MGNEITNAGGWQDSPFEQIKRTNDAGAEFWSSREFAGVLAYGDYRNFEGVVEKAKLACFNSGHRIQDHFVDITEMIENNPENPSTSLHEALLLPEMMKTVSGEDRLRVRLRARGA